MDYNTGDSDNAHNTAQLITTMSSPIPAYQPFSQDFMGQLTCAPAPNSLRRAVSEGNAGENEFNWDLSYCDARSHRRVCSLPPIHPLLRHRDGDALDPNGIDVGDAIENDAHDTAHMSCATLQASPPSLLDPFLLQTAPAIETSASNSNATTSLDDTRHLLAHSGNEIRRHIHTIKQNTFNRQINFDTAMILADELADLMAAEGLATSEEIVQMRCNVAKFHPADRPLVTIEPSRVNSQIVPLTISSISELSSVLSGTSTFTPSPREPEAINSSPETENRSTQTDMAAINTGRDVLSDASYNGVTDIELWERELESIRRLQPLVDGRYTTVNVPLREPASQLAPPSRRVTVSTLKGSRSKENPISEPKSVLRPTPQSAVAASGSRRYKNNGVIIVHDTSDEEHEDVRARSSHVCGGGDFVYGMDGIQYAMNDENGDADFYSPSYLQELKLDGNNDMNEDIREQEVIQYANQPTASTSPFNHNFSDGTYHREESYDSHFLNEESGESYASENSNPQNTTARGRAMATDKIATILRGRSRSPGYKQARPVKETPYREKRCYDQKYTRNQSPTQVHGEKKCSTGRVYAKGDSAFAYHMGQCGQVKQRYIRDKPENPQFYGYSGKWSPKEADSTLRYQDRFNDVGEIPGPKSSLRLNLDGYVKDTAINDGALGLERSIENVYESTFYAGETVDEDQALLVNWANERTAKLYKGFPLVENIGFVSIGNRANPEGDCYWRALAYIIYGQPARWDLIKADHQVYLRHVLGDKTHPRHELYTKLNTQFFETHGPALKDGSFVTTSAFKANIWQLLHMPHSWTPGVMQQITADLYNLHLVTFTYDSEKNMCSNVSIRGAYNSRHVFMLFKNSCHFQPLVVNDYISWEFRYPRVTVAATARFSNAPKANSKKVKHLIQHPWRNDWTKEVPPPVPKNHGCDLFQLRKYMAIPRRASDTPCP
ncbi:hypothetical protein F4859DRAFT_522871 [Xylaria cf. heliscus]|nr:hypothetical protein F4859DRAFT_522871 [Xylaria cf. heliscus]